MNPDVIEAPDTKIAQHIGFLTMRVIALEHEREALLRQIETLTPKSEEAQP